MVAKGRQPTAQDRCLRVQSSVKVKGIKQCPAHSSKRDAEVVEHVEASKVLSHSKLTNQHPPFLVDRDPLEKYPHRRRHPSQEGEPA